jgi:hypothetical protein
MPAIDIGGNVYRTLADPIYLEDGRQVKEVWIRPTDTGTPVKVYPEDAYKYHYVYEVTGSVSRTNNKTMWCFSTIGMDSDYPSKPRVMNSPQDFPLVIRQSWRQRVAIDTNSESIRPQYDANSSNTVLYLNQLDNTPDTVITVEGDYTFNHTLPLYDFSAAAAGYTEAYPDIRYDYVPFDAVLDGDSASSFASMYNNTYHYKQVRTIDINRRIVDVIEPVTSLVDVGPIRQSTSSAYIYDLACNAYRAWHNTIMLNGGYNEIQYVNQDLDYAVTFGGIGSYDRFGAVPSTIFCFNQLGVKANVTYTTAGTTYEIGVWPSAVYIPYQRVETGLEEISVYYNSTRSYTNFNPDGTIIE